MTNNLIHQEIIGNGNVVAGGNIQIKNFTPDINTPGMMYCRCKTVISQGADECKECNHNHLRDRLNESERQEQEVKDFFTMLGFVFIAIIGSTLHISSKYQIELTDGLMIVIVAAGFLWYGYEHTKAYVQIKFYKWMNERILK